MSHRKVAVAAAIGLAIGAATAAVASAQRRTAVPPAASSVAVVQSVRLDAVVVDPRGKAIEGLKAGDFELREGGRILAVDEAQFVQDSPRVIAVYVDEYHISPGASVDRAREALTEFVDHELGPDDRIAVVKPLDSLQAIRLTGDFDAARRVIAGLEGRSGDYAPRTDYERNFMAGATIRIEAARTQVVVSALNSLAEQMGSLNDLRKTLLVVSEGFDAQPRRRGQEYLATVESTIRSANRANVSIYPLDPRPLDADAASNDVMRSLADGTNGRIARNEPTPPSGKESGLADAIRAAVADADAYYMLTYHAAHVEDGAFHAVDVRVKRPRVQLRARSGYWSPSADDRLAAELLTRPGEPPMKFPPVPRLSPLIQPWFGLSLGEDGKNRVTFVWEPTVQAPGAQARPTAARLELTVLGADDTVLFEGPVLPTGPGIIDGRSSEPVRAIFSTEPGPLQLRMKIQDASRQQVDSDVRQISVRDLRGKVAIGTPEFLRARNAREFREIDGASKAAPVSTRQFSRTERLLVRFPAYAPDGHQPSVAARLLNRSGQAMRTLEVRVGENGEHEVDISLAALASGDYQLELAATSAAGNTTEVLAFRVTS